MKHIRYPSGKRLYYLSGIFSLLLLAPLLLSFLNKNNVFQTQRTMEVTWYDPASPFAEPLPFAGIKFHRINLSGNKKDDKIKLDFVHVLVKDLMSSGDTTSGIQVHFDDHAKYESFVRALNICKKENVKVFAPYKSDLWILNRYPKPKYKASPPPCGGTRHSPTIMPVEKKDTLKAMIETGMQFWPSALLFLVMAILMLRRIVKWILTQLVC